MPPIIDIERCTGCGLCAAICPMHIFTRAGNTPKTPPVVAYPEECWHCNACGLDCPAHAIALRLPLNYMLLRVDASTLRGQEA